MKKGSALLMALWTLLVLGMIVMSFAYEAKLQGGVNLYVQGKNRVKRLVDAGKILGEMVIINYKDAKEPDVSSGEADWKEIFEDEDRWCKEKYELKKSHKCTIGPILMDEENPGSGTVKVEIEMTKGDSEGGVNINKLCKSGGDNNYVMRWQMILDMMGVPRENNFRTKDGKTINLQYRVICCWDDYVDEDDYRTDMNDTGGSAEGAEEKEYTEYFDDSDNKDDYAEEDCLGPANCEIDDLKELSRVLCFREYPALLTGGVLNPWESKDDQIIISQGIVNMGILGTGGTEKLDVNHCSKNELLTVPGIFQEDDVDEDDKSESEEIADAIVKCRSIMPKDREVDETRTEWPYDGWDDLCKRVSDEFDVEIGQEAKNYLVIGEMDDSTVFKMKISASLMGMSYTAECECYVKDKKVRYTSWKEY